MDHAEADKLVKQLSTGFETLQEEYQKLFGQHESLERKLATAREQVSSWRNNVPLPTPPQDDTLFSSRSRAAFAVVTEYNRS